MSQNSTQVARHWLAVLLAPVLLGWVPCCGSAAAPDATSQSERPAGSAGTRDVVALIDEQLRRGWRESQLLPARRAAEGLWCRRLFLDVVGRMPTVAELEAFLDDRRADRRQQLVDRLLGDAYVAEYARNWTTFWTNLLIGHTGGTERRTLTSRAGMQDYLRRAFTENRPYDRLVKELVAASGSTRPGAEDFNGATNFLVMKLADNGVQATAKTAQIFLGIQVQCTQCHNHPFNDWKQNQFWELNAFFRQTRALRSFREGEIANVRLADQDFAGEGGDPAEAELYYERRNGLMRVAYPVFVDGTALTDVVGSERGNSGYLEDVHRRQELARLIVGSRYLDRAIVNRLWGHFFGYGFTKPVDDMGPHNRPAYPELLDQLGSAFTASGYNLKKLIRWLALSEAYGLSSRRTASNQRDGPQLGQQPKFSHFYVRQMRAEELYESLLMAGPAGRSEVDPRQRETARQKWLQQFLKAYGTDENDETTTFDGTIPQTLMLMNGPLVRRATGGAPGSFLQRVADDTSLDTRQKITRLYLAAVARRPAAAEIRAARQLLTARGGGGEPEALQDIWWALLNSNEFILNH